MRRFKDWFGWKEPESREDKLNRLAAELKGFSDEERRRFIRRVWQDAHLSLNPPKGVPKKKKEVASGTDDIS